MAEYPGVENERRFPHEVLHEVVQAIFERCGMAGPDARVLTDQLVKADLRGIHSHGVMRVPLYVGKLTGGAVDPRGTPRVRKDASAAMVVDGGNSMGQIAGVFAMQAAIERARSTGVAVAAVGNSNHAGAMEYYVLMAIDADMIGIATTNALPTWRPGAASTSWSGSTRSASASPGALNQGARDEVEATRGGTPRRKTERGGWRPAGLLGRRCTCSAELGMIAQHLQLHAGRAPDFTEVSGELCLQTIAGR